MSLVRREALKLPLTDGDVLATESNRALGALLRMRKKGKKEVKVSEPFGEVKVGNSSNQTHDEGDTVGVERLVAGLSARHGDAILVLDGLGKLLSALRVVGADEGAHGELDEVEGEEPDNVPDPGDSDVSTRDALL